MDCNYNMNNGENDPYNNDMNNEENSSYNNEENEFSNNNEVNNEDNVSFNNNEGNNINNNSFNSFGMNSRGNNFSRNIEMNNEINNSISNFNNLNYQNDYDENATQTPPKETRGNSKIGIIIAIVVLIMCVFALVKLLGGSNTASNEEFYNDNSTEYGERENINNQNPEPTEEDKEQEDYDDSAADIDNQTVSATIDIHDFEGFVKGTTYKSYINKKITIINVPVKKAEEIYYLGIGSVGITCDNVDSLVLTENTVISITGVVNSKTTSDFAIMMNSCSIEQ